MPSVSRPRVATVESGRCFARNSQVQILSVARPSRTSRTKEARGCFRHRIPPRLFSGRQYSSRGRRAGAVLRLRSRRSGFKSRRPAKRKRGRARKTRASSGGGIRLLHRGVTWEHAVVAPAVFRPRPCPCSSVWTEHRQSTSDEPSFESSTLTRTLAFEARCRTFESCRGHPAERSEAGLVSVPLPAFAARRRCE